MSLFLTPSYIKFSGSYRIFSYAANVISVFFRTLYKKILQQKGYQKLINYKNIWIILQFIILPKYFHQFISVAQSCLTLMQPHDTALQVSLTISNSQSLPKSMSTEWVMPSNHLILCHPLLLLPSIFPSIRVFSNESALHMRWPKYWSLASTSVLPKNTQDSLF